MSLSKIRTKVSAKLGITDEDILDSYINEAAEELWKTSDLVGALKETILWYDGTTKEVALPYFVLVLRGIRYYNSQYQIPLNDMRPRYQTQGFGETSLNWREKSRSSLHTQITDQSTLIFKLPFPLIDNEDVTIRVIGKTPNSYRTEEALTITAGETEIESKNDYEEIYSITKDAPNKYNIKVYDANEVELAEIPNSELSPKYTIIQVLDDNIEGATQTSGVEIMYKPAYHIMQNDGDEFQAEGYDDAIFWKVLEVYYGREDDDEAVARAQACQIKCNQILNQVALNFTSGKKLEMDFKPNKFYSLFRPRNWLGTKFRT